MRIAPIERIAIGFLLVLLAAAWFHDTLFRAFWIGELLIDAALWLTALILAAFAVAWAFRGPEPPVARWRLAVAMPLALAVAFLSRTPTMTAGSWAGARLQLWRERPGYETAAARARGRPLAFSYLRGIPDGGVAIVRWHGDPSRLPVDTQVALTGERIRRCRPLAPDYHLCGYD